MHNRCMIVSYYAPDAPARSEVPRRHRMPRIRSIRKSIDVLADRIHRSIHKQLEHRVLRSDYSADSLSDSLFLSGREMLTRRWSSISGNVSSCYLDNFVLQIYQLRFGYRMPTTIYFATKERPNPGHKNCFRTLLCTV